jgi:hypothetical protein
MMGRRAIACVDAELSVVTQRLAHILPFTQLVDSDATVHGVVDAFQSKSLAPSGPPNRKQPFGSSFAMRDGPLMIREIMESHWQDPEFAFLSACHFTVGDESSPDEAIPISLRRYNSLDFAVKSVPCGLSMTTLHTKLVLLFTTTWLMVQGEWIVHMLWQRCIRL